MRYYGKIHSKLPIFCVKSVKIYTGQKKFTRTSSVRPWQIWGMWTGLKFMICMKWFEPVRWTLFSNLTWCLIWCLELSYSVTRGLEKYNKGEWYLIPFNFPRFTVSAVYEVNWSMWLKMTIDHLGHFCCGLYSSITVHSCVICKSVLAQCLFLNLFFYIYHLSIFASALQPAWSLSDQMAIYNATIFKLNDYFVELNPANFKVLSMILNWIHRRNYFE